MMERLATKYAQQGKCEQASRAVSDARAFNDEQGGSKQLFKYFVSKLLPACPGL